MQKAREEREKAIHAVLLDAQNKRLKELFIQRVSFRALLNAEIQADLKLDDAQKASIKDLQAKQQEANRAIFQRVQSQELTREEAMASIQKNEKVLTEELGKILKDGQKAQFEKMAGAKFQFDDGN
jgi:phosphoribosyl-dephospho-CoA transferase